MFLKARSFAFLYVGYYTPYIKNPLPMIKSKKPNFDVLYSLVP